MKWFAISAFALAILGLGVVWVGPGGNGDEDVKADFTILLDEPIAREGGAVLVLPTPRETSDDTAQIQTEVRANGKVSIVRLFFPEGSSYTYRFRSIDDRRFPNARISTERLLVGSSTGVHPDRAETEEIPTVLTHHVEVAGGGWTKSQTRVARTETNLGFLTDRYACEVLDHATVCDATHHGADK